MRLDGRRLLRWLASLLLVGVLTGCASGPNASPRDPLEPLNRQVTAFNDAVDGAVLKPVATVYRDVTPDPVRTGVNNFFENLRDVWSFINASLQLRPREAAENFLRFNVNTFFGVAGLFDVASEMGIERTRLDFGQTLGRWGVPSGPYLVCRSSHSIKNTPNVIGFLGAEKGGDPVPLRQSEVNRILGTVDELAENVETNFNPYHVGEGVKVIDGPFNGFNGVIEEINEEKKKLKVMVKIFGRKTPLELSFMQVEKEV